MKIYIIKSIRLVSLGLISCAFNLAHSDALTANSRYADTPTRKFVYAGVDDRPAMVTESCYKNCANNNMEWNGNTVLIQTDKKSVDATLFCACLKKK